MKRIFQSLLFLSVFLLAVRCDVARDEVEALRSEVTELQTALRLLNTELSGLQSVIGKIESKGYAVSTEIFEEDGAERLAITFKDGSKAVVGSGRVGADGSAAGCRVGIREEDGVWYWTLDGNWLELPSGERAIAIGKDGYVGITPQLSVEDGNWMLTLDGGATWETLAPVKGEDGFFVIAAADFSSDRFIVLTLADGQEVVIPRYRGMAVELSVPKDLYTIAPGEVLPIPFSLSGEVPDSLLLVAGSDGKYQVQLQRDSETEGTLLVTGPDVFSDGFVNLMVDDRAGNTAVRTITFHERIFDWIEGSVVHVDAGGGRVTVPYLSSFDGSFVFKQEGWLRTESEISSDLPDACILEVAPNGGSGVRVATIEVQPADHPGYVFSTLTVVQSSLTFSIDNPVLDVPADGGTCQISITSAIPIVLDDLDPSVSHWVERSLTEADGEWSLRIDVRKHRAYEGRRAEFGIRSDADGVLLGTVVINQHAWSAEHRNDMVLTVRANLADDYTVYLPLRGEVDCLVNWGDGHAERIERKVVDDDWVFHRYEAKPETYTVTVSGAVEKLNAAGMPNTEGVTSIEQWGRLGLKSMVDAFRNFSRLTFLPPDLNGAFEEVTSFDGAFYRCIRLTELSENLFSDCPVAVSFDSTFTHCTALSSLPEQLFSGCGWVETMQGTFAGCTGIREVPEDLFVPCPGIRSFASVFNGSGLESIPEDLFAPCPEAEIFAAAFCATRIKHLPESLFAHNPKAKDMSRLCYYALHLEDIPSALFAACPEVETFEGTFGQCYGLQYVPVDLFDANRKVRDFGATFWDLNGPFGETPYSLIDGKKVHLYERILYPDAFVAPVSFKNCFGGQFTCAEDDPVPADWR